ncbi:Double-stranded RNA-binding protein 4 [Linum grandiflorum]
MSKSALNELCQRQKWPSPVYSTTKVGPDHTPVFRATVTVNGAAFASESVAQSSKGAQAEAARVALLQLSAEIQVQDIYKNMYKNLLQERAQRGGGVLPVYETRVLSQGPSFISTVALEGYVFSGLEAKSKKVAEMSAAKAAYTSLTEGNSSRTTVQEPVLPSPNVGSAQPSMPSKQKGIYMGSSSGTKTQEPLPLLILLDHLHQHILNVLHASHEKGDQLLIANPVPDDSPFPGDRCQKKRMAPENNSNGHKHSKSELPSIVTTTTPVLENV